MSSENDKVEITIDVTDWSESYDNIEPDLSSVESAVKLQQDRKLKPQQMGRLLAIDRERNGQNSIVKRPHKLFLNIGYANLWSAMFSRRKENIELQNGKEVEVRKYIAQVQSFPDGEAIEDENGLNGIELVDVESKEAVRRAELYLRERVMGYIVERLKVIAVNGGDVKGIWQWMKKEGDKAVKRLIE